MSEQDWREKIPESVRSLSIVQTTDTEETFWKRIADQQSFLGQSIRIPSGDASPEAQAEFREKLKSRIPSLIEVPAEDDIEGYNAVLAKLGRPDKAEDYVLAAVDGYEVSDAETAYLRGVANESGMTKKQFEKFSKKFIEGNAAQRADMESAINGEREGIKKEWGMAVEEKYSALTDFAKTTGAPPSVVASLENRTASVAELKWLEGLQKAGVEKPAISAQQGSQGAGVMTPYEARERINEILNNPTHGYHRMEKQAVARMLDLQRAANA